MKTFYVLFDGHAYLCDESGSIWYSSLMDNATKFDSLSQAFDFMQSSGLQFEVHRIDITPIVYDLNQDHVLPEN